MKRIILIAIALCMFAVPAFAGPFFSTSGNADAVTSNAVAPAAEGLQAVVFYMNFDGAAATTDLVIYNGDVNSTSIINAEAAGQTALTVDSCTGFDNNDVVVIMDPDGDPIRATVASACNDTTDVMTVTAVGPAFVRGAAVFEMVSAGNLYADIGTAETEKNGNGSPIVVGKEGKPLAVLASGGDITILTVSGEYK